jgi:hypothetical protein
MLLNLKSNYVESLFYTYLAKVFAAFGIAVDGDFRFECFVDYRPANPKQEKGNGRALWAVGGSTMLVKADGPNGPLVEAGMIRAAADAVRKYRLGKPTAVGEAKGTGPIPKEFSDAADSIFSDLLAAELKAGNDARKAIAEFVTGAKKIGQKRTMLTLSVKYGELKPFGIAVPRSIVLVDAFVTHQVAGTKILYRNADGKSVPYVKADVEAMLAADKAADVSGQPEETVKGTPEHSTQPKVARA